MFKEADILTIISSEKKAAKSSHSILSGEFCQLSYKKVYFLLLRNIIKNHTMVYFFQYIAYFCLFYRYAVNGISGNTDLVC
jgi:hypothetical protein